MQLPCQSLRLILHWQRCKYPPPQIKPIYWGCNNKIFAFTRSPEQNVAQKSWENKYYEFLSTVVTFLLPFSSLSSSFQHYHHCTQATFSYWILYSGYYVILNFVGVYHWVLRDFLFEWPLRLVNAKFQPPWQISDNGMCALNNTAPTKTGSPSGLAKTWKGSLLKQGWRTSWVTLDMTGESGGYV